MPGSIYFSCISPEISCPCTCVEEYIRYFSCISPVNILSAIYLLKYPALVHVLKNIHEGQYISAVYLLKYPALVHVLKNIYEGQYISAIYILPLYLCRRIYTRVNIFQLYIS